MRLTSESTTRGGPVKLAFFEVLNWSPSGPSPVISRRSWGGVGWLGQLAVLVAVGGGGEMVTQCYLKFLLALNFSDLRQRSHQLFKCIKSEL